MAKFDRLTQLQEQALAQVEALAALGDARQKATTNALRVQVKNQFGQARAAQEAQQQQAENLAALIGAPQPDVRTGAQTPTTLSPQTLDQALGGASGGAAAQQQLAQLQGGQPAGQSITGPTTAQGGLGGVPPVIAQGRVGTRGEVVEVAPGFRQVVNVPFREVQVEQNVLRARDALAAQIDLQKAKIESGKSYLDKLAEIANNPEATPGSRAVLLQEVLGMTDPQLRELGIYIEARSSEIAQAKEQRRFEEPMKEFYDPSSISGTTFGRRSLLEGKPGPSLITAQQTGVAAAGLTKPTQNTLQDAIFKAVNGLASTQAISRNLRQEFLQTPQQWKLFIQGLTERLGRQPTDKEIEERVAFSDFRTGTVELLTTTLNQLSGVAVTPQEAERLKLRLPTLKDSFTDFVSKLRAFERMQQAIIIRNNIFLQRGLGTKTIEEALQIHPELIFSSTIPGLNPGVDRVFEIVEQREVQIANQLRRQRRAEGQPIDEDSIEVEAERRAAAEFGIAVPGEFTPRQTAPQTQPVPTPGGPR